MSVQGDLISRIDFVRFNEGLKLLKEYFQVSWLSATQIKVTYSIPKILQNGLTDDFLNNIIGKTFILDTSVVGFSTMSKIGGIVDGDVKRVSNFYSAYPFFDDYFKFVGLGLVQCNKTITSTGINKSDTSQDLTITTGSGNYWSSDFVPVEIYKDTTNYIVGEAKRKDANTLTVQNCGTYGSGNISAGTVYIKRSTAETKQEPYNVLNNLIAPYWLWQTSCIRINSSGDIEYFVYNNKNVSPVANSSNSHTKIVDNSGLTNTLRYFDLLEYISPAASLVNFKTRLMQAAAGGQSDLVISTIDNNFNQFLNVLFATGEVNITSLSLLLKYKIIGLSMSAVVNINYYFGIENYIES